MLSVTLDVSLMAMQSMAAAEPGGMRSSYEDGVRVLSENPSVWLLLRRRGGRCREVEEEEAMGGGCCGAALSVASIEVERFACD